ncbi:hypothetical protein HZH68_001166 [Vespula germanica]|uniref:Uncharacterized protein n=1 Tax=Vespula germanica TaxID=30212 RepID=A0A834NV43_VESGE|nr:hypothetical protein HZH68_001166 [Vespula germanica]
MERGKKRGITKIKSERSRVKDEKAVGEEGRKKESENERAMGLMAGKRDERREEEEEEEEEEKGKEEEEEEGRTSEGCYLKAQKIHFNP